MATKVREIRQGLDLPSCRPETGGCCSIHRRTDRIYEDRLWEWAKRNPGEKPHR